MIFWPLRVLINPILYMFHVVSAEREICSLVGKAVEYNFMVKGLIFSFPCSRSWTVEQGPLTHSV